MATTAEIAAAATKLINAANKYHSLVHGPASGDGSNVSTDAGNLPTFAKLVAGFEETIGALSVSCVSFSSAQSLSGGQKTQARDNMGLGTAATKDTGTTEGSIPLLGSGGKLSTGVLPTLDLMDTLAVANESARLGLSTEVARKTIVVDSDTGKSWGLVADGNPATSGDWVEIGAREISASDVSGLGSAALEDTGTGSGSIPTRGTDGQLAAPRLVSLSGNAKVDIDLGQIFDSAGLLALDWLLRKIALADSSFAADFGNRQLINGGNNPVIDWSLNQLIGSTGVSVNWDSKFLIEGVNTSLDWGNRQLKDSGGNVVFEWSNCKAFPPGNSNASIDWANLINYDTGGTASVEWGSRVLTAAGNIGSVEWGNRLLKNSSGNQVADWSNGFKLSDHNSIGSADAGTIAYDITNQKLVFFNGSSWEEITSA